MIHLISLVDQWAHWIAEHDDGIPYEEVRQSLPEAVHLWAKETGYDSLLYTIDGDWTIRELLEERIQRYRQIKRPSVLFRPRLFQDGDQWCALYGEDLQEGCAGFGATPEEAMKSFDEAWSGA